MLLVLLLNFLHVYVGLPCEVLESEANATNTITFKCVTKRTIYKVSSLGNLKLLFKEYAMGLEED